MTLSRPDYILTIQIPGYGISTACKTHSKKAVGSALLEALELVFKIPQGSKRKVILGGHDRGARICHRIAVDKTDFPNLEIVSLVVLDIVPTKVQWEAFANPSSATNYWHWSFLPNVEIATEMIQAFGGDKWCRYQMSRIQGPNQECRKKLAAGGALDLYAELFKKRETIVGACEDYASGAQPEVNEQSEDMQHGRRVEVPTLALWSAALIGSKLDVGKIWREWVTDGVEMKGVPIGNGAGHYLPEENSKEVVAALADWVKQFA